MQGEESIPLYFLDILGWAQAVWHDDFVQDFVQEEACEGVRSLSCIRRAR